MHDHQRCVIRAMHVAEKLCEQRELLLTPIRRRILELILERHAPIGAYDILGALKKGEGASTPATVYRTLEFLLRAQLIHRIDALSAFVACKWPDRKHTGQFLICRICQSVTEIEDDSIAQLIASKARTAGFTPDGQDVEIKGICASCGRGEHAIAPTSF